MKIQVISLKTSDQRRESISRQFELLDTEFEFFDAITPEYAPEHINGYDEEEFTVNCGRPATATEIACYASHLALWRRCVEEGVPYLILEDDALLDDMFLTGLLVASSQMSKLGFIRLSVPEPSTSVIIRKFGPISIHYCCRVPLIALGYAISPGTAEQLVRHGATIEEPVDKYLQRYWRHDQPVFAVEPPVVRLADHAAVSDIGAREMPKLSLSIWLRRAARKSHNSLARSVYAFRFRRALPGGLR